MTTKWIGLALRLIAPILQLICLVILFRVKDRDQVVFFDLTLHNLAYLGLIVGFVLVVIGLQLSRMAGWPGGSKSFGSSSKARYRLDLGPEDPDVAVEPRDRASPDRPVDLEGGTLGPRSIQADDTTRTIHRPSESNRPDHG